MPDDLLDEDQRRPLRTMAIAFAGALLAVVVAFVITIVVVVAQGASERERICDTVKSAFHEQAVLFGEFTGPDDDRVATYDEALQARIERDCG